MMNEYIRGHSNVIKGRFGNTGPAIPIPINEPVDDQNRVPALNSLADTPTLDLLNLYGVIAQELQLRINKEGDGFNER